MEADDILAHQMSAGRAPELIIKIVIVKALEGGYIVDQSIEPDVDDVLVVEGNRDAPIKGGAGNTQVFQTGFNKIDHFIAAGLGSNEIGVILNEFQPAVGILAHTEEIALLLGFLHFLSAVRAYVFCAHLRLGEESLAGRAVPAFVFGLIDIALVIDLLEQILTELYVIIVRGADKVIVIDVQHAPQLLKRSYDLIHELFGRFPCFSGSALYFLAVFIGTGEKIAVITAHPLISGHRIRSNGGIGMADMQIAAGIIDGRSDVERGFF